MSGHSKWHNIQKTKGAQDAKRAQAFTKIAREMIVAVKEGGSGDPANNSRLAAVVAKAKAANMPNDNIKRTIEKALGSGSTDNYESVTYEGYGPSGVAVIVDAMTNTAGTSARPTAYPGPSTKRASLSSTTKTEIWMRTPFSRQPWKPAPTIWRQKRAFSLSTLSRTMWRPCPKRSAPSIIFSPPRSKWFRKATLP